MPTAVIQNTSSLDALLSTNGPVLIFKHSTACPVSAAAYGEFQSFTRSNPEVQCGLILVIEQRDVSNRIAERTGIRHESPQAILLESGLPVWNTSHWDITSDALTHSLSMVSGRPA